MPRRVLLPDVLNPDLDWAEQTGTDFFAVRDDRLVANLSPDNRLRRAGVPSPWSEVLLRRWILKRLDTQQGQDACNTLKVLLLLQFFGLVKPQLLSAEVVASGGPGFQRLLRMLLENGEYRDGLSFSVKDILVWTASDLPPFHDHDVVAGSHPDMILYPAAGISLDNLRRALTGSPKAGSSAEMGHAVRFGCRSGNRATDARHSDHCTWAQAEI
jgi:hypothetical protein